MATRTKTAAAKPAAEAPAAKPAVETKGTAWLTEHVNETCGTDYPSSQIRILLRKLVKDGVLERAIGEDRGRYEFPKGANDPIVKAVVKAVKDGAVQAARKEKIAEAQATKAAKSTPAAKPARSRAKAKPAPTVDDEFDDDDVIEEL